MVKKYFVDNSYSADIDIFDSGDVDIIKRIQDILESVCKDVIILYGDTISNVNIIVKKNCIIKEPIRILIISNDEKSIMVNPRVNINLGQSSSITIVEHQTQIITLASVQIGEEETTGVEEGEVGEAEKVGSTITKTSISPINLN